MATIPYSKPTVQDLIAGLHLVLWEGLTHDDDGEPYPVQGATDKVVQIVGTVGADDSIVWEASLERFSPTTFFTLHRGNGEELSMTAQGGDVVLEGPVMWIRPRGIAGTAQATDVDCHLAAGAPR